MSTRSSPRKKTSSKTSRIDESAILINPDLSTISTSAEVDTSPAKSTRSRKKAAGGVAATSTNLPGASEVEREDEKQKEKSVRLDQALLGSEAAAVDQEAKQLKEVIAQEMDGLSRKSQWITLAILSGVCAAFNGVFAKLTTTSLTTTLALSIAKIFGAKDGSTIVEALVRGFFFVLNLIFNGIMWTLFTKALARGTSTTQVTILNTSSNFLSTALLGLIIFRESLPAQWFVGAVLLVAGNVIIGRREEGEKDGEEAAVEGVAAGTGAGVAVGQEPYSDEVELDHEVEAHERRERDDLLDFGGTVGERGDV